MTTDHSLSRTELELAFEAGRRGDIRGRVSNVENSPAWQAAFQLGLDLRLGRIIMEPHMVYGCGCLQCRFEKIVKGGAR